MKRLTILLVLTLAVAMIGAACGGGQRGTGEPVTLRLMTHDSFDISRDVLAEFERETGVTLEVFKAGDGGEALNKAILSKDAPLADVFYGVDNTFLSRALANDLFVSYASPQLENVPDEFKPDETNRALPVDYGDVCLNYDVAWFQQRGIRPPETLADLAAEPYRGLTVVQNPATSTPGLAFLLTTISAFGEDGYLDYWRDLTANDVLVVDGWEQAYYGHFTAASEGDRPIVVSYASSPAAEVYFAETPPDGAPTAAVTTDGTCFRQIEFAGILRGTQHEDEARMLINFMLDQSFQEDMILKMFVYPVNQTAQLPDVFVRYSIPPESPVQMEPERIAANREAWIQAWTESVLR